MICGNWEPLVRVSLAPPLHVVDDFNSSGFNISSGQFKHYLAFPSRYTSVTAKVSVGMGILILFPYGWEWENIWTYGNFYEKSCVNSYDRVCATGPVGGYNRTTLPLQIRSNHTTLNLGPALHGESCGFLWDGDGIEIPFLRQSWHWQPYPIIQQNGGKAWYSKNMKNSIRLHAQSLNSYIMFGLITRTKINI